MMVNVMNNLGAAASKFAGFFAAVLFVYYSFIQNRKPGMAAA